MDISNKKGFGTIDVLFALGIMGLMIGGYARQESENYSHRRADSIANSVSSVMDATKFYIGNNYNALLSHLNVGQSMEIPLINNPDFMGIGDLATNSSLLPSGFTGKVAKGQTLHLIVKHMAQSAGKPDYLSGMVMTTGGANLTDREVGLAVNEMGLSGGGVMSKPPIGHTSGSVYGGYGTWSYPVTQWQVSGVTPSVGHIAMVTDSFSLPTGDYLSRYNGSNPEGIRMHTDLDMGNGEGGMSGNQLNGVHAIFGANNQDTRLQDTYHSGRVNFGNGGIACANDSMGCHFDIGTKGGFYDNEDQWITFQNNSPTLGLKNSNTTDVLGATLDNDILTKDGVSYSFSAGGAPGQTQDAALTYGGGWINATGGSGFQGISAYLMQAKRFQDRADNSYYFVPSQLSRLNELQLAGKLTTNGYDINAGFNQGVPALGNVPSLMAGGLVTNDVYGEGGLYNGNSDGHAITALMANGNGYIGVNAIVGGNVQAKGTVSTDGLDASNPQAWDSLSNSGGVHTTALKSDGGSVFVGSNYSGYAGSGLLNQSKAEVSGIAKASVFRTMGFHPTAGTSCTGNVVSHTPETNQIIGVTLGGQVKDNTPTGYQYGDIAADASGHPLSCVNGVWKPFSNMLFSTFNGCNTANQWTNTTGSPEFVSAYENTSDSESNHIEMYLISPQGTSYLISSSDNPSDRGSKRYSVDGFVPAGWSARIDSRFGVNGVCHWGGNVPNPNNPTSLPDIPDAPDPVPPPPPPATPYDNLSCYVMVVPNGNNDGKSSWGVRASLRCGPVEQWIPGVYYGPRVTASVEVLGVGDSTDQLSFPRSWFENYGIKTTNIFLIPSGKWGGVLTNIDFSQYPAGSIVSYLPITNPAGLYSNGITDWYNVEGSAHYENNNKTHNVTQLITYANGNQNKTCVSAINDPSVSSIPVIGFSEFQYRQNAPFACGN